MTATLGASYFDGMYARSADPWGFTSRWYERRKYAISLAMLPRERYRRGFEPGCSIGVLTRQLAGRCDRLLACDVAAAAVRGRGTPTAGLRSRPRAAARAPGAVARGPVRPGGLL